MLIPHLSYLIVTVRFEVSQLELSLRIQIFTVCLTWYAAIMVGNAKVVGNILLFYNFENFDQTCPF